MSLYQKSFLFPESYNLLIQDLIGLFFVQPLVCSPVQYNRGMVLKKIYAYTIRVWTPLWKNVLKWDNSIEEQRLSATLQQYETGITRLVRLAYPTSPKYFLDCLIVQPFNEGKSKEALEEALARATEIKAAKKKTANNFRVLQTLWNSIQDGVPTSKLLRLKLRSIPLIFKNIC